MMEDEKPLSNAEMPPVPVADSATNLLKAREAAEGAFSPSYESGEEDDAGHRTGEEADYEADASTSQAVAKSGRGKNPTPKRDRGRSENAASGGN